MKPRTLYARHKGMLIDAADHVYTSGRPGLGRWRCWLAFNKPAWQKTGKRSWTVHYRDTCHIVQHIVCRVPIETHERSAQPVSVMRGWAKRVDVFYSPVRKGTVAEIT